MAKSGQYIPQRSQPEHLSPNATSGGWYPFELNAEESARTWVGQNSTQKPPPLQRSTMIATWPLAMGPSWNRQCASMHALGHLRLSDLDERVDQCATKACSPRPGSRGPN